MPLIVRRVSAVFAAGLLAACSAPAVERGASGATGATSPPRADDPRDRPREPARRFDPAKVSVKLEVVADGFSAPLLVTHAGDGSGRLFVVEQDGRILILRNGDVAARPFLDITDLTEGQGEQGLLGLAFHPRYERNGRFFVNYTDNRGDTVIEEYRGSRANPNQADRSSGRVLLTVDQPFPNHNGGALVFGPDGYLYIALGDGGAAGDPQLNGQRLNTLLGKILRIDVDERSGDAPYGIPPDNPFVGNAVAREEIWAYGLRNPWRISFDRVRGDLWIADVGQNNWEEINRARKGSGAGANYGWNIMEGNRCFVVDVECKQEGLELPIAVYSHDEGCSVTGGYVYRGSRYPSLQGGYFFGDFCSGTIWVLDAAGPSPQKPTEILSTEHAISSFGENEAGEIFVTDLSSGEILQVTSARR